MYEKLVYYFYSDLLLYCTTLVKVCDYEGVYILPKCAIYQENVENNHDILDLCGRFLWD